MSIENSVEDKSAESMVAQRRLLSIKGEPLFLADWLRPVFVHYEVPAQTLQRDVPFALDLHGGKAYVSLVAFTMRRMRPFRGGKFTEWFLKPIANNHFLNVRTYVRHRREPGIYFLTEWMNNPLSVRLGPWTFGLPYRFGELHYQHPHKEGKLNGTVREKLRAPSFSYEGNLTGPTFAPCTSGSLDAFLLERYTAFTSHGNSRRFFRIWHEPWKQQSIQVSISDTRLLQNVWPWFADAKLVGANYSPGAHDVWMGRPHRLAD
ncbi:MAG TPA: DUF2071 domain-containing protein [Verrucomicrobiae bacterium]|nr:DUF2071 domain-containing protein [Verrucomicrobiae bacterium]